MKEVETKKTGLYDFHVSHGAKMVEFAGFWMPVQYTSMLEEHKKVRTTVGVFDVSHMGFPHGRNRSARTEGARIRQLHHH